MNKIHDRGEIMQHRKSCGKEAVIDRDKTLIVLPCLPRNDRTHHNTMPWSPHPLFPSSLLHNCCTHQTSPPDHRTHTLTSFLYTLNRVILLPSTHNLYSFYSTWMTFLTTALLCTHSPQHVTSYHSESLSYNGHFELRYL